MSLDNSRGAEHRGSVGRLPLRSSQFAGFSAEQPVLLVEYECQTTKQNGLSWHLRLTIGPLQGRGLVVKSASGTAQPRPPHRRRPLTNAIATRSAVLVDPHPLWLDALEAALAHIDVRAVAKATSLGSAARYVAEAWPDVIVGEMTYADDLEAGLKWVEGISSEFPATKIVVFSACTSEAHIASTLSRGADAYVLKQASVADFTTAVRQLFQPSVFLRSASHRPRSVDIPLPAADVLTRREFDILRLASEGHSNARIARILWVTEQTVKFHLSNVYRKIGVANRTEAGRWAQVHGVLDIPSAADRDQLA